MKRSVLAIVGAAVVLTAAVVALAGPFNTPVTHAASSLQFEAKFETSGDFFNRFDFGYSGQNPFDWPAGESILSWNGDHDMNCGGPTTSRTVAFGGDRDHLDYSQLFWYCAPGGDGTKGHLMTGVNTHGYNILWFSPKPLFTATSKVCWDINETTMSRRKWTQVLFVSQADATKYPVGSAGPPTRSSVGQTRGSGGYDLGYVSPEFDDPAGVTSGIISTDGSLAGFKTQQGGTVEWFQGGDFTFRDINTPLGTITDKAARYTQCLEQTAPGTVTFTQQTPSGTRSDSFAGSIPQGPVRVVFEDDNYNPPKDSPPETPDGGTYNPNVLTWHWDNIQVFTSDGTAAPASTAPSTTVAPTTTATTVAPTTAAPTTAATTTAATTVAPTTGASTTVAGTVAPTTVGPIDLTAAPTTAASTTSASTTVATTVAPTTVATTAAPTTVATTAAPTTVATTVAPTTVATTAAPTTVATTVAPTTAAPTTVATTVAPTTVATTAAPTTVAPTTVATTAAPTTVATTVAPTTAAPTTVATTVAPTTAAPTTGATTVAPTTAAPLGAQSVDTTPPAITITGGPPSTTTDRNAVISFTADDGVQEFSAGGALTFTAALDGGTASPVTSPVRIAGLPLGDHILVIKATDQAGNVGSALVTWKVIPGPSDLTGRGSPSGGSSARTIIAAHKSALEAAIKGGGLRPPFRLPLPKVRVADNVVVRTAVPPPAQEVLAETGARTMENVVLGLTLIGLGLVLAGVASGFRRRTS